jgi:hypothetical protein
MRHFQSCVVATLCFCLASIVSCGNTGPPAPTRSQEPKTPQRPKHPLTPIPAATPLAAFHDSAPYTTWPHVTVKSKAVQHDRRVYFQKASRVFVSDTLTKSGKVGVVEVIRVAPPGTTDARALQAQFLLFDPVTGTKLEKYPDDIQFQIAGAMTSDLHSLPELCLLCHMSSSPLIRVYESTPETEKKFQALRDRRLGMAFRIRTVEHIEDSPDGGSIEALNFAMEEYPDLLFDILDPN